MEARGRGRGESPWGSPVLVPPLHPQKHLRAQWGRKAGSPMALRACLSSRAKAVRGTSSDTGMMATVDRLLAGFPKSHLLPVECSPNW